MGLVFSEHEYNGLRYVRAVGDGFSDNTSSPRPTLLFLHGAGSRGNDISLIKGNPFMKHASANCAQLDDCIIYAPQCDGCDWFGRFERLIAFAEYIYSLDTTDRDRFYLAGVSMGGYGSWELAISRPELFAAFTPLCGGGMYWQASRLKNLPIRAYHGALDTTVQVSESINMVNAVNKAGGHAELVIYPDLAHNCWDRTFSDPGYYTWLFSQSRKHEV